MFHVGFNVFGCPELQRVVFHVGFSSFDEESSCFMWVLTLFRCPELQRVVFHVVF